MRLDYSIGLVRAELYFRGARTLKDRRSHLRSLRDRLENMGFSVAQTGPPDIVSRTWLVAVTASGSRSMVGRNLDRARELLDQPVWELVFLSLDIMGDGETLPEWETS
ncbi:MAG: hypothetical protein AVO35_04625 [Candidatus Aegiribacteria sp. MLS_C]|nr:MAG: hypothetical protein AVO35_04625 [Candidatus Aegiribacteria sp. MLS_C]